MPQPGVGAPKKARWVDGIARRNRREAVASSCHSWTEVEVDGNAVAAGALGRLLGDCVVENSQLV